MSLHRKKYKAFTLIEILVALGLMAILLSITILAINPQKSSAQSRNVKRWNGVRAISNGLEQWLIDDKVSTPLLEGDGSPVIGCASGGSIIVDQPTTNDGEIDLDAILVGTDLEYMVDLPRDPTFSSGSDTGYRICRLNTPELRFKIYANQTELGVDISAPNID